MSSKYNPKDGRSMNKKGVEVVKMLFFLIASLLVGGLILVSFSGIVGRLLLNTEEQIAAKDIGLTIMTVSSSPNDILYMYDKNTEGYEITIHDGEVTVKSQKGSGKYKFIPMNGVHVENAIITNAISIPFSLKDGELSFSDATVNYADICSGIPVDFGEEKITVNIEASPGSNEEELNNIKNMMAMYSSAAASRVVFKEGVADVDVVLAGGTENRILYFENADDSNSALQHKISCYAKSKISTGNYGKENMNDIKIAGSSEDEIRFIFDENSNLFSKSGEPQAYDAAAAEIAKSIYDSIESAIAG